MYPIFITLLLSALGVVCAPLENREVFVPPVIYPNSNTVWKTGHEYTITWDVSRPPKKITNKKGAIYLATNRYLDIEHPLGKDIDIMNGRYRVTVPHELKPGCYYQVVGNSGNYGKSFCIEN